MRENITQTLNRARNGRQYIAYDWFTGGIPGNVAIEHNAYIDSAYGFAAFHSQKQPGLHLQEGSGCYDRNSFIAGAEAEINVGKYTILNGTTIICNKSISIGDHCMLAWGSVVTDTWFGPLECPVMHRQHILKQTAHHPQRIMPAFAPPLPVTLEDNTWIGFGAIVMPGVTVGHGAVIGCKTIVHQNIPPYAVVVGNPARIIRYLNPDDTEEMKEKAMAELLIEPIL